MDFLLSTECIHRGSMLVVGVVAEPSLISLFSKFVNDKEFLLSIKSISELIKWNLLNETISSGFGSSVDTTPPHRTTVTRYFYGNPYIFKLMRSDAIRFPSQLFCCFVLRLNAVFVAVVADVVVRELWRKYCVRRKMTKRNPIAFTERFTFGFFLSIVSYYEIYYYKIASHSNLE